MEQTDFEEHLVSSLDCINITSEADANTSTDEMRNLPLLDLFLNPERTSEHDKMQKEIQASQASVVHTEVYFITSYDHIINDD